MRKILTFLIILISIVACKKSDKEILEKTISMLDGIERVRYQSTLQATESGTTYLEKTDTLFFDFKVKMGASTPRYFLKDSVTELIFEGKTHIQSLSNEKVVLTDDSANPNNPLLITLFPIKVFLPKLLANQDVTIIRKKDSLITQKNNYVFDITINNGYLDWEKLEIRSGVGNDTKYSLTVRKSDLAPVKFVMQNGESGSFSRTMENFDFDYLPSEEL